MRAIGLSKASNSYYRAPMGEEPITCRYVFTTTEFKRASRCFYWHSTLIWFLAICLIPILALALLQDIGVIWVPVDKQLTTWDIANNLLSLVFFVIFMALIFTFFSSWSFRKMPSYNQAMQYTLSAEGIHLKTALFEVKLFWHAVTCAAESKWGIVLFLKGNRSFHWLPKSGFENPADLQAFRALLRQQVNNTRKLGGN
jgi:hypothetical protein